MDMWYDSGNYFYRILMPRSKVSARHYPVKAVEGHYPILIPRRKTQD